MLKRPAQSQGHRDYTKGTTIRSPLLAAGTRRERVRYSSSTHVQVNVRFPQVFLRVQNQSLVFTRFSLGFVPLRVPRFQVGTIAWRHTSVPWDPCRRSA